MWISNDVHAQQMLSIQYMCEVIIIIISILCLQILDCKGFQWCVAQQVVTELGFALPDWRMLHFVLLEEIADAEPRRRRTSPWGLRATSAGTMVHRHLPYGQDVRLDEGWAVAPSHSLLISCWNSSKRWKEGSYSFTLVTKLLYRDETI